jgi:methionyl aminopeptidase
MVVSSEKDLAGLRRVGRVCALTLRTMAAHLEPGMTTAELDQIGARVLQDHGARSAPILAYQFPGWTCISINDEAAHGIPGPRAIQPGDLVNIDVSAELEGYWADMGASFVVPPAGPRQLRLLEAAQRAHTAAAAEARAGRRFSAIGRAVEAVARQTGFRILRDLGSHGVGRHIHEEPHFIPAYVDSNDQRRFSEGMVITIEPFLSTRASRTRTSPDGWTLRTVDGSLVAQFEHTYVITRGAPIPVTVLDGP